MDEDLAWVESMSRAFWRVVECVHHYRDVRQEDVDKRFFVGGMSPICVISDDIGGPDRRFLVPIIV
jgi:hypothetical protein